MSEVSQKRHDDSVREVITVRGIAAAIQAMVAPTFKNLGDMLSRFGWKLVRKQTNQHGD